MKKLFFTLLCLVILFGVVAPCFSSRPFAVKNASVFAFSEESQESQKSQQGQENQENKKPDLIRWVDFNAGYTILKKIYDLDVKYHNSQTDFDFCSALAYLAVKNGNNFNSVTDQKNLNALVKRLESGEKIEEIIGKNKYYPYYLTCYRAIFSQFIGEYVTEDKPNELKYGLKAYFPFPQGYWVTHYDDFGGSRSFGYKRRHLGHDMMGGVGTPIIAVEGGTITELGWNRFGGWRIGILSHDKHRYFYYAHLRKDHPYAAGLQLGDVVEAGRVIGYLGNTGYSSKENQNLKSGKPHLHIGMQLIFDDSQKKGNGEIWIDLYAITSLLSHNKARVERVLSTREYRSKNLRHYPFLKY